MRGRQVRGIALIGGDPAPEMGSGSRGPAPCCDGECPDGCKNLSVDSFGDGDKCYTGTKVLCDCTDNPDAKCP